MSSRLHSSVVELRRAVRRAASPLAPPAEARRESPLAPRHSVARALAHVALAPLAALAAAAAGLVFVVLLPICGIASLAEGFARAAWRAALGALPPRRRGAMSQD